MAPLLQCMLRCSHYRPTPFKSPPLGTSLGPLLPFSGTLKMLPLPPLPSYVLRTSLQVAGAAAEQGVTLEGVAAEARSVAGEWRQHCRQLNRWTLNQQEEWSVTLEVELPCQ